MADRYLPDVIDKILKEVPKGEKPEMVHELTSLKESAKYSAPELMTERWHQLASILNHQLGWPMTQTWHHSIHDIVSGKK